MYVFLQPSFEENYLKYTDVVVSNPSS